MYELHTSSKFNKDYERMRKRGYDLTKLRQVVNDLVEGRPLQEKHRDHALTGRYVGMRECHIEPDWLLVYEIDGEKITLVLIRTGTHSDLFR